MYYTVQLSESPGVDSTDQLFQEAVFANGKEKLTPIIERIQKAKEHLEEEVTKQEKSYKDGKGKNDVKFDPDAFWKSSLFKDLEDEIGKVFGFRNVSIEPFVERYNPKDQTFQSKVLNCMIWNSNRYPIEGLVTDNGFYDKSRSINIEIAISLGLIRALEADEIMAVLVHEFGHGIDPALVDIHYTEANILSKYLTDRKGSINGGEKKYVVAHNISNVIIVATAGLLACTVFGTLADAIYKLFKGKDALMEKKAEKVRKMIAKDKDHFDRQNFSEAFADNFARMYGLGPQLARGLQKMGKGNQGMIESRCKRERKRQEVILEITKTLIKDEHKTDIHRVRALIKEYEADINDPNTNPIVKKQLTEDMEELKKILDEYMNNFSEFQNRVNRVINEELERISVSESSDEKKEDDDDAIKESCEFFGEKTNYEIWKEKHEREKAAMTPEDRKAIREKYRSKGCGWGRDKDGVYCYTHRCRSKSYPSVDKIPKKVVDFIVSTG